MIRSYKDLEVWQLSRSLVKDTYILTQSLPKQEQYGLVSQMRRAAISVPSNIAEDHARAGRKDFKQFLSISLGSLSELETQIILCVDIRYVSDQSAQPIFAKILRIRKMLYGLINSLENTKPYTPNPNPHLSEITYGLQ